MTDESGNEPAPIRPGEELDEARLRAYLSRHLPPASEIRLAQFPSGYSNLTYLLQWGELAFVLRRPPFGSTVRTAHDMGREFRVLRGLHRVYDRVPRPVLYCDDPAILGAPFYLMERVEGVILRRRAPADLDLSPPVMARLSTAVIDNLARLHAVDVAAAGLGDLGNPVGYIERQIEGWLRRYRRAQTDHLPDMDAAGDWLRANRPAEAGAALIHNDYKYDNLVLDPADLGRIVAVLDWEMATLGDPLMDLGTTLGYWMEPGDAPELARFGLTSRPGNLSRVQLVERYARTSGQEVPDPLFYFVYGLFKIGGIIQQIYARFRQGHTTDARFATLLGTVQACGRMAVLAIERGRIDRLGYSG